MTSIDYINENSLRLVFKLYFQYFDGRQKIWAIVFSFTYYKTNPENTSILRNALATTLAVFYPLSTLY